MLCDLFEEPLRFLLVKFDLLLPPFIAVPEQEYRSAEQPKSRGDTAESLVELGEPVRDSTDIGWPRLEECRGSTEGQNNDRRCDEAHSMSPLYSIYRYEFTIPSALFPLPAEGAPSPARPRPMRSAVRPRRLGV